LPWSGYFEQNREHRPQDNNPRGLVLQDIKFS